MSLVTEPDPHRHKPCIGLTGGIGCGKSTVARMFAELGAGVVDTDAIAHRLTQADGAAIPAIRDAFGDGYITTDGALDRKQMRDLIFSDARAKLRLEQLLHPLILEQSRVQLRQLQGAPYIIIVVPLLPESPAFRKLVQRILAVDCEPDSQVARVMRRSSLGETEVRNIIARQTPRAERLSLADDIIHNDASLADLAGQVTALHQRYARMQTTIDGG
ncbi:MAG: dephospho-CoA kinase [Nitrosomonadales bacterium]|nr:dephospho-CoA kinase [Nitrosomonadales bacterium]